MLKTLKQSHLKYHGELKVGSVRFSIVEEVLITCCILLNVDFVLVSVVLKLNS